MSMIVPAGNKKMDWSPKDSSLTKQASSGSEIQEEVNPLYEAAKKVMAASEECSVCKKANSLCSCAKSDAKSDDAKSDTAVVEFETAEGEKAEGEAKKDIEVAVDKIEEAVVDLKDAVQKSDVAEEKEVEVEVDVEDISNPAAPEVKEEEVVLDIPGKEISNNEIIVESTPDATCACASKDKDAKSDAKSDEKSDAKSDLKMDKSASTDEEFCRFAMLSKVNKDKLAKYWVEALGFPKDYVALMTKDYEK